MKHLVLGYASKTRKRDDVGDIVFLGSDRMEADAAIAKSDLKRFEYFPLNIPSKIKTADQLAPKANAKPMPREKLVKILRKRREKLAAEAAGPEAVEELNARQKLEEAEKRLRELEMTDLPKAQNEIDAAHQQLQDRDKRIEELEAELRNLPKGSQNAEGDQQGDNEAPEEAKASSGGHMGAALKSKTDKSPKGDKDKDKEELL